MSHSALLEVVGQALLPLLGSDPEGGRVDASRLARDVWAGWARDTPPAERQVNLHALAVATTAERKALIADVVRRVLPGRAEAAHGALTRYLSSLPALLSRLGPQGLDHADDLIRRLPTRVPMFQAGDRPTGVGDRELVEIVRLAPNAEAWLARNPELPGRPAVLLVFFPRLEDAQRILSWLNAVPGQKGLLYPDHSFLGAESVCLQFPPVSLPLYEQRAPLFRPVVEAVAGLHRRTPPVSIGKLEPGDVYVLDGHAVLMPLEPPHDANPRQDMPYLGRMGKMFLPAAEPDLADLLAACVAPDPLARPASAVDLLAHLPDLTGPSKAPPPEPIAPKPRARRGTEVWKVLDTLQKAEPERPKLVTTSVGMRFVLVPAGRFVMGSPKEELGRRDNEGPAHEVLITNPFYLAVTPVTQEQYHRVLGVNPSRFQGAAGGGPDHPVECVSWDDAKAFLARLGELLAEAQAARTYRLPTEAEWEYACRAGSTTAFHCGAALSALQASLDGSHPYGDAPRGPSVPRTAKVGSFSANHFGLYDMHGNVWEWCADWYDAGYYRASPRQDPLGPESGIYRVLRGGSWRNQAGTCRSAYRNALAPNQRQPFIGFRPVLVWEPPS